MDVLHGDILAQPRRGSPVTWLVLVVATAWALIGLAVLTQHAGLLDHHQLMGGHTMAMAGHYMRMGGLNLPLPVALAVFLASWQVMTAAMMLPASLSTVALFAQASRSQAHPRAAPPMFLAGYAAAWTAFALAAFLGALLLMRLEDAWPWLAAHPWVVGAATLALAGAFEFSALKARSLAACRSPALMRSWYDRPSLGSAWSQGLRHGKHCVGSCGALMGIMFGTEVAAVPLMTCLTAVMLAERTLPSGPQLARVVGSALLLLAAIGLWHPAVLSLSG